ncbi:MAG: hypothetical protein HGA22_05370 [Clostridiales bacterium]|nr:hypothetical protein [Clostridiales bacterium]
MNKKLFFWLGNGSLILGAAIGIYALAEIFLLRSKLPAGVCPVTSSKPLLYVSITLCILSFVVSFFEPKKLNPEAVDEEKE